MRGVFFIFCFFFFGKTTPGESKSVVLYAAASKGRKNVHSFLVLLEKRVKRGKDKMMKGTKGSISFLSF